MTLSEFVRDHRDAIVVGWARKVRAEILERDLTEQQLLDDLHLLLDQLIETLRTHRGRLVEEGHSAVARAHGRQRHTIQHRLPDVVREYGLLFEAILEASDQFDVPCEKSEVIDLSRCLCAGAAEAVDEFAAKSDAERRRVQYEGLAFLAHEIRNPLMTARIGWEVGRRNGEIQGASVERLDQSLGRVAELVDHAILQSKLEMLGSGAELRAQILQLNPILKEALDETLLQAADKRLQCHVDSPEEIPVKGDPRLLRSALSNVVRNAVKFTRVGGSVTLRARRALGHVRIDVEDECGGLPPERAERLFEAFVQGPGEDRRGFGLGLAIARQALEAHRGTVNVKNRPGVGCTFTIELPIDDL